MNFQLTRHAAEAMERRGIKAEWVEQALVVPTQVEPDKRDANLLHHLKPIEAFGGRVLRVIFDPSDSPVRVVTLYFDRTAKDLL
ncbi:MAG: DUF4258 domain-containing protein [Phycisphaeraceae bacterium]